MQKKNWSFRKPDERKPENKRELLKMAFCKRVGNRFAALGGEFETFQAVKDAAKARGYNRVKMPGAIMAKV